MVRPCLFPPFQFSRMQRSFLFLLLFAAFPLLVGCDGCRKAASTDPDEGQEKAPKEAYSTEPARVYPSDQNAAFGFAKPGHWMTAEQSIRSNKADARGDLVTSGTVSLKNRDLEVTGSVSTIESVRPVVLPKGQMRRFDFRFRCPSPNNIQTRRANLSSRLLPRSGGVMETGGQPVKLMQGSEYFFVVLTNRPEQFTRFQVANWASTSENDIDRPLETHNYRIVVPDAKDLLPMPETVLDMSSISVIFWDDLSEDALTPLQQNAIADWVHFGGRLIVNGADGSDAVSNTMLADLLPLIPTSNIELDSDAAAELIESWSVASDRTSKKQIEYVKSEASRIAVDGQLTSGSRAIDGTANLILERRTGRGTVIQPRFDLTGDWIESWHSYDSFINGVILGRPSRKYAVPSANDEAYEMHPLYFSGTKIRTDASVNTQFRIASRDSVLGDEEPDTKKKTGSVFDPLSSVDAVTGIGAWTDRSDAIRSLQSTLTQEAGIEIPGSDLVVRSLVWYLIVLVPINYLVFRLMNRLEYAWFAVPVIALIGAAWAARQARLDIGFARSNTELAILEAHAGYPRGHLTRLVGVYNSLSSRYTFQFKTVDGIASTLAGEPDAGTSVTPVWKTSFEEGPSLDDFGVSSNRMRYAHTEEMIDLGGFFSFDDQGSNTNGKLVSESSFQLLDAVIVKKSGSGDVSVAAVGDVAPGQTIDVKFRETKRLAVASGLPMQSEQLIRMFAAPESVPNGSCRLVARIDASMEGLEITPAASQRTAQTIVLIHLKHSPSRVPEPDENLVHDFARVNRMDTSSTESDSTDSESAAPSTEAKAK